MRKRGIRTLVTAAGLAAGLALLGGSVGSMTADSAYASAIGDGGTGILADGYYDGYAQVLFQLINEERAAKI